MLSSVCVRERETETETETETERECVFVCLHFCRWKALLIRESYSFHGCFCVKARRKVKERKPPPPLPPPPPAAPEAARELD